MHTIDSAKIAAVATVAAAIIPGTQAADDTVVHLANSISAIVVQRARADLSLTVGQDALDSAADALISALNTRRKTIAARLRLFAVTRELGLDYGDTCPCEDVITNVAATQPAMV